MDFLKRIFSGADADQSADRDGLYYYVKASRTGEVIQVRLNRANDLSLTDDGNYFARKLIVGQRSFDRIEAEFFFDRNRRLISADMTGGELVEKADYDAYQAQQSAATDD